MINVLFACLIGLFLLAVPAKCAWAQENGTWQKLGIPQTMYTLEVTPWGIYSGEFSSDWRSYNGVYVSYDLGETWKERGLVGRGVTDITYDQTENLYATVYYWGADEAPGLYKSTNKGSSWTHISPDFSAGSVGVCGNNIILGSYSYGLWFSEDGGSSWVQKFGDGTYGEDFLNISVNGGVVVTSNYYASYISYDCGENWQTLPSVVGAYLSGVAISNNIWLVCSETTAGLYRSTDSGKTFYPVEGWSPNPCYAITYYNGVFYTSSHSNQTGYYNVLKSLDRGLTWQEANPTDDINNYIHDLSRLAAEPGYIFATSPGTGLYRYKVPPYTPKTQPFLSKLWNRNEMDEQTDTITSYFDHSYPFLAYPYKGEGAEESDTTTNFWGDREKPPKLYYSSHDGVDFGLKYGTPILAPAPGYASYSYTSGGGNTIKIDHQNGYQTQYLHLQKEGLFTGTTEAKWIDKGQQIGLVGLTGNTTGPHLHFGVRYDKNSNGNFNDDVPDGRVDPYSWLDETKTDPWQTYSWTDALGEHIGSESAYLWEDLLEAVSAYLDSGGGEVTSNNVKLTISENALDKQITLKMQKTTQSNAGFADVALKYIQGTAIKFTAHDNVGNSVTSFANLAEITFDLTQTNLVNVAVDTLKILYFNNQTQVWEEIASVWDETTNKITGFTNHLSEFAVFGEKIDANPPVTTINITGKQDGLWYTESPTIELSTVDGENESGVDKIFYSLDGGDSWEEYLTQTQVVKEGTYAVLFRSSDLAENYETAKESPLLRVDTVGRFKDEIILSGGVFTITLSDK